VFIQSLTRRWGCPAIAYGVVALLVVGLMRAPAPAQDLVRKSLFKPGDPQPIQLYADEISTWLEGGKRVFLLKGRVYVEQGINKLRADQGVAWVDEARKKNTGIYYVDLYADGEVVFEEASRRTPAAKAHLELATRGEVRIKAYASKVAQRPLPQDPVYRRARTETQGAALSGHGPRTAIQKVSGEDQLPLPPTPVEQKRPSAAPPPASPLSPEPGPPTVGPPPLPAPMLPQNQAIPKPPPREASSAFGPPSSALKPEKAVSTVSRAPGQTTQGPAPVAPAVPPASSFPGLAPPVPLVPGPALAAPPRSVKIRPRSSLDIKAKSFPPVNGETPWVVTTGVIISVTNPTDQSAFLDIEADRMVVWKRGGATDLFGDRRGPQGEADGQQVEFYLAGNVEIRNKTSKETQTLRADEVYYDVGRNVAVALRADLEVMQPKLLYPLHVTGEQVLQIGPKLFQATQSEVFSSALPSDPGLRVTVVEATLEERDVVKRTIFGFPYIDRETGLERTEAQKIFRGRRMVLHVEDVPIFYLPYIQGDPEDPLGPLEALSFKYNDIFGFQFYSTFNVYDLLGIDPIPGTRWRLFLDYLSKRGPAAGTEYDFAGSDLFGIPNHYQGLLKAYGIYDTGDDILGGDRGRFAFLAPGTRVPIDHPDWRGRLFGRLNVLDLPAGFLFQGQLSLLSDRGFHEQYFNQEFVNGLDQDTYGYLKQQQNQWAWSILVEPRLHDWFTSTEWLPRADYFLLGQKLLDNWFTYNLWANAGYGRLRPTEEPSFAYGPTDRRVDTGRFDVIQELSLPLAVGPFKVVPYVVGDITYYTEDLFGDDQARFYGGGGARASLPFSRLYPDACSELFNLNGVFHKIVVSGNYYHAVSDTSMFRLPQLDRLNDDATDQALRDIRVRQLELNPEFGAFLISSPIFDPQLYALRRLILSRIDTRDDIEVLQLGLRQRWQTKRGFPGNQHIIDWMTLDLQGSIFPHSDRDSFGETVGILEYDWIWNIGDRTALVSNGWFEPVEDGPRVFNFGATLNRPDRTSLYLGYRHIDPLESRAVVGALSYAFSAKYAITASSVYDFGVDNQVNSLTLTRIGTDLQVSLSVHHNSILDNFGVGLEIMPNLLPASSRRTPGLGTSPFMGAQR